MRPICACGAVADCSSPHAMCRVHAVEFFTAVVRIGAGLAELHRACAEDFRHWLPLPPVVPTPGFVGVAKESWGRPRALCRFPGCEVVRYRPHGKLCQQHLKEAHQRAGLRGTAGVVALVALRKLAAEKTTRVTFPVREIE